MEGGDANDKPALLLRLANVLALIGIFAANGFAGKNIGTVARRWNNHIKPDGWRVLLRVFPLAIGARFPHAQGSSGASATVPFVWRGLAQSATTRTGASLA